MKQCQIRAKFQQNGILENCRKTEKSSLKLMFLHIFEICPDIASENKKWCPIECPLARCFFPVGQMGVGGLRCVKEITSLSYNNSIALFNLGEKTDTSKFVHLGFKILSCSSNLVEIPLKLPACAIWPEFPLKSSFISLFSSALKLIISQQWTLL